MFFDYFYATFKDIKMKKLFLLSLIVPLIAFTTAHKFYISVSNINYSQEDKALQIVSRIFIDDIEDLLEERYEIKPELNTENELENINQYIGRYLKQRFVITLNGKPAIIKFLGKEYDVDIMKCYIEVPNVETSDLQNIEISNKVLFELFEDQQNVIHVRVNNQRKSLILMKENHKGMLNF
jgi:hypothetical protein